MSKPKTEAQKKQAQDKRLQKTYGITLADRDERIHQQNGQCKICGGALDAYGPPNVDHFHFKVRTYRCPPSTPLNPSAKWFSQAYDETGRVMCTSYPAKTKEQAIKNATQRALPQSVRGLLCFKCNKGLGYIERFFNAAAHPDHLLPVIDYLRARLK
jgi:5-methylcytosine-specific restriction endonuclease McrA